MGFNSVYRSLLEIFPQVDGRILKAVAIEHSKDADAAVEIVLSEVLPFLSKQSVSFSSPPKDQSHRGLSDGVENEEQNNLLRRRRLGLGKNVDSSSEWLIASEDISNAGTSATHHADSTCLDGALNTPSVFNFYDANHGKNQLCGNIESKELKLSGEAQENSVKVGANEISNAISNTLMHEDGANSDHDQASANNECGELVSSLGKFKDINVKIIPEQTSHVMSTTLIHENGGGDGSLSNLYYDWKDFNDPVANDFDSITRGKSQVESCLDGSLLSVENSAVQLVSSAVQEHMTNGPGCDLHLEDGSGTLTTDCDNPEASASSDIQSKQDNFESQMGDVVDESTLHTIVTRSGQICRIDLVEEIIEDAKNNKKNLFSAMESVMNMMREVELQEKAAEQAKEEAANGGLNILVKVEELKQMLVHAKEANDMHAGEVYGEKAILATEVKELQMRLLNLSDERDGSLAILDEMREALEARLAAAEEVRKAAEREKLEKEESAQNALAEQEAIMEKVVQESKILQQEAEENSKLREFLIDRGRVVDSLQGEISVICQDVRLLKEKFDERVPLSKSVSSSQTSCILASSSSSLKSVASDLILERDGTSKNPEKTSPTSSVDGQSPKIRLEEEKSEADRKKLVDDGWDFFDDTEQYS